MRAALSSPTPLFKGIKLLFLIRFLLHLCSSHDEIVIHGGPGMATVDRFKLNNLSFAGPVVMGVGGECVVL